MKLTKEASTRKADSRRATPLFRYGRFSLFKRPLRMTARARSCMEACGEMLQPTSFASRRQMPMANTPEGWKISAKRGSQSRTAKMATTQN
eukprot:6211771-Pleurochrysis_carterae.AAC.2